VRKLLPLSLVELFRDAVDFLTGEGKRETLVRWLWVQGLLKKKNKHKEWASRTSSGRAL
jgi:hypothetical protein